MMKASSPHDERYYYAAGCGCYADADELTLHYYVTAGARPMLGDGCASWLLARRHTATRDAILRPPEMPPDDVYALL